MFPIVTVPDDASTQLEQLGTKAKFWFSDEHGRRMLFKQGRPGTGENWAEKVCCELARLLGLPHADYHLAEWRGQRGIVTPSFVPDGARLVHGNELLAKFLPGYRETVKYGASQHTVRRVVAVLGSGLTLAPTFDHASSLGRNERDEVRQERLTSKDRGRSVERYVERAKSGFYLTPRSPKPLTPVEAFVEIAKIRPAAARYWLGRLESMRIADAEGVFSEIPRAEISAVASRFALIMIEINRRHLLAVTL